VPIETTSEFTRRSGHERRPFGGAGSDRVAGAGARDSREPVAPGPASRCPSTVRSRAKLALLRPQLYDNRTVWSAGRLPLIATGTIQQATPSGGNHALLPHPPTPSARSGRYNGGAPRPAPLRSPVDSPRDQGLAASHARALRGPYPALSCMAEVVPEAAQCRYSGSLDQAPSQGRVRPPSRPGQGDRHPTQACRRRLRCRSRRLVSGRAPPRKGDLGGVEVSCRLRSARRVVSVRGSIGDGGHPGRLKQPSRGAGDVPAVAKGAGSVIVPTRQDGLANRSPGRRRLAGGGVVWAGGI
jgi:hypothetical protein